MAVNSMVFFLVKLFVFFVNFNCLLFIDNIDQSEFGKVYLMKNLPTNFDSAILENADLFDFGQEVLAHKQGEITSYGAISGRGQELYSALTVQPEQQLDEDFEEDFELEMGSMNL